MTHIRMVIGGRQLGGGKARERVGLARRKLRRSGSLMLVSLIAKAVILGELRARSSEDNDCEEAKAVLNIHILQWKRPKVLTET